MTRTSENAAPVRCGIYTRKSTEDGLEQDYNSLDAQREACEAYIASQRHEGWVCLPDRYDDGGFSGGTLERPGLQRLLGDISAGKVNQILVYKVDRLSRSLLDFTRLVELFEQHNVSFVSITQSFSTNTAMGKLTLNMLLSFAEFERAIISERVRDKVAGAKRKGMFTGGTPVLGYDIAPDTHKLVLNPDEAKIVRHIFRRYGETGSALTIAKELNAKGITTKTRKNKRGELKPGTEWNAPSIYRVLNNITYLGETRHFDQTFPGEHKAIVSRELWDAAHAVAQSPHFSGRKSHTRSQALLAGIIRCGCCGRAMYATWTRSHGKIYCYYVCVKAAKSGYDSCDVKSVPAGEIEGAVVNQLRVIFRSPDMARTYMVASRVGEEEDSVLLNDTTGPIRTVTGGEVADALSNLDLMWDELFPAERQRIVKRLVEQVTIYEDGLDLRIRTDGIHSLVAELRDDIRQMEVTQ
jgi:site-specific DNA recombinase